MPRKLKECDAYRISPRVVLRPGDTLRFRGGGPVYFGDDGEQHRLPLAGVYELRAIHRQGKRTWFDVVEIAGGQLGATRTVLVSGRSYRSHSGLLIHPYKVARSRRPQPPKPNHRPRKAR